MRTHNINFSLVENWEQLPDSFVHRDVADVAVDSRDRVYVLARMDPRVIVYDANGEYIDAWGEGAFSRRPHGITIGPDDTVYVVDELDHTIKLFALSGQPKGIIGVSGRASDTGVNWELPSDREIQASIARSGPPFNRPTKVAVAPNGDLYVSDGYGNSRVHHFAANGELLGSWGEPGVGPGQFRLAHWVCVAPDGRVFVADREGERIQIFTPDGEFITQWADVQRPTGIAIAPDGTVFVTELGWTVGEFSWLRGPIKIDTRGRLSVFDESGILLHRFGEGDDICRPGILSAPHGLAIDSRGDLYVTEVAFSHLSPHNSVGIDCPTLQKFTPRSAVKQ
jgi:DNA-binding beta-propeller fold protein YncE